VERPAATDAGKIKQLQDICSLFCVAEYVAAVSPLNGTDVWMSSSWVNGMTAADQVAMMLHGILHLLGPSDDTIQLELGLPTNQPSENISQKLKGDCFQ
jgi:hypothetical protein